MYVVTIHGANEGRKNIGIFRDFEDAKSLRDALVVILKPSVTITMEELASIYAFDHIHADDLSHCGKSLAALAQDCNCR